MLLRELFAYHEPHLIVFILLVIIPWEIHIMNPIPLISWSLSVCPSLLCLSPQRKAKKE